MNKKQEEIIKKYAHDYRDVEFDQDELRVFLEHFSKELLKAERKEIMNDLLKRAKKGELEELRREVEDYFKQQ